MGAASGPGGGRRERRLIRRLQERDEAAFTELVQRYQGQVYNLVYRMLGSHEEAEDLAQEVFVTVFKAIDRFRGESQLGTWIYRVALNTCRNRYKYLARRRVRDTRPLDEAAGDGAGGGILQARPARPDEALVGRRLEAAVEQALRELDEEQREVLVLRDIEGLSYQEITAITGLPAGTVKSRIHRARVALKDRLRHHV